MYSVIRLFAFSVHKYRHGTKLPSLALCFPFITSLFKTMFLIYLELFHQPTLMHNFLYSLTICLLHYFSRNVSSINMPIFRRKNCIHTASGIFALCKRMHSTPIENILLMNKENCALKLVDEIILYYDARSKKHQIT